MLGVNKNAKHEHVRHSSACLVAPWKVLINSLSRSLASLHDLFFEWIWNQKPLHQIFPSQIICVNTLTILHQTPNFLLPLLGVVGFNPTGPYHLTTFNLKGVNKDQAHHLGFQICQKKKRCPPKNDSWQRRFPEKWSRTSKDMRTFLGFLYVHQATLW